METFVKVQFWIMVFCIGVGSVRMSVVEFPKQKTETLGNAVSSLILQIAVAFWAAIVLWMR